MTSPQLTPACKALPPQRWGFLPTDEFWTFAFLTPVSVIFWVGAAVFIPWLHSFSLVWWQNAIALLAFWGVWGGFVERWSRRYLARRRRRLLAARIALPDEAPASAPATPRSPLERALVPSQEPRRKLPIVATAEFWDHAFERLFGRAARVAHILFDLAVFMTFCYPAWQTFLLTFLVLLAIALCLGWWQRRLILAEPAAGAEGGLALVESTGPGLELGDDRRAGDPHEPDAAESSS